MYIDAPLVSVKACIPLASCPLHAGFSDGIARWVSTNLRPTPTTTTTPSAGKLLDWTFDLAGIAALYESYERDTLWPLLQAPPQGLKVDFVKAERSTFR